MDPVIKRINKHVNYFFYLRCKDHQPSDGLGAHRLILAAASSRLKEILLEVSSAEDELICLHLPDYTSVEVGPVMSLLYYGETWITESCAQVCQDILQVSNFIYIYCFNFFWKKPQRN